jgi:hypothetical protein
MEEEAKACGEVIIKNNILQKRSMLRRSTKRSLLCMSVPF